MTTAARDRVATWVNLMQDAKMKKAIRDQESDRESLDRAADLEEIYQEMAWVGEMPEPKRKRLGRRIDPKSRQQFAKWVKQTYNWGSHQRLGQLHASIELVPILATAVAGIRPAGEWSLRPFAKLRDQGYGDHQADVWLEAVNLADGATPTESQVRKAVKEFLERHKPPIRNVAADPRTAAERRAARRARLLAQFDEILAEENREAKDIVNEIIRHYNEHQASLREDGAA